MGLLPIPVTAEAYWYGHAGLKTAQQPSGNHRSLCFQQGAAQKASLLFWVIASHLPVGTEDADVSVNTCYLW